MHRLADRIASSIDSQLTAPQTAASGTLEIAAAEIAASRYSAALRVLVSEDTALWSNDALAELLALSIAIGQGLSDDSYEQVTAYDIGIAAAE